VSSEADSAGGAEAQTLERLLRRDHTITLASLGALCALAWLYIAKGAGLGMSAWQMTTLSLFPHQHPTDAMPAMDTFSAAGSWGAAGWTLMIAMWWIMMAAMMTPSATPAILLYARIYRHSSVQSRRQYTVAPTGVFAAGYLLVWLAFSVAAASLHWALQHAGLISPMMMTTQSRWLSGAVLIATGIYQLSPLKRICLVHCRTPAPFLSRHWRPNLAGALRLGVMHGAYCVGCCWMLMTLLFVGGVMNLVWITALGVLVLIEKAYSAGQWVGRSTGIILIVWGAATLLV
jgi:predicted metal-binding membrane protein